MALHVFLFCLCGLLTGLVITNFLSFCLSKSNFTLAFEEGFLSDIGFLIDRFFFYPFSILTLSAQSLLVSKVSHPKSTNNLIEEHLAVTICFSLDAFKILSLSLSFEILIIICLDVDVFEFILLPNLLSFLVIYIHVFHQIWEVFSNYFFKSSLCPFLFIFFFVTPKMCMLIHLTMFHGSLSLFSHSLFFPCPSDSVIFLIRSSSLLILSACSNLPWSHSSEFFIVVILLSNPRFFFHVLYFFIAISILFVHLFLDFLYVFL